MESIKESLERVMDGNGITLADLETAAKQTHADRDRNGRFAKGNKGGGRPKLPKEFYTTLKGHAMHALKTIIDVMDDEKSPAALRLKASTWILEHSYGKALELEQSAEYNMEDNPFEFDWSKFGIK